MKAQLAKREKEIERIRAESTSKIGQARAEAEVRKGTQPKTQKFVDIITSFPLSSPL